VLQRRASSDSIAARSGSCIDASASLASGAIDVTRAPACSNASRSERVEVAAQLLHRLAFLRRRARLELGLRLAEGGLELAEVRLEGGLLPRELVALAAEPLVAAEQLQELDLRALRRLRRRDAVRARLHQRPLDRLADDRLELVEVEDVDGADPLPLEPLEARDVGLAPEERGQAARERVRQMSSERGRGEHGRRQRSRKGWHRPHRSGRLRSAPRGAAV
jgi:hypothetical protein